MARDRNNRRGQKPKKEFDEVLLEVRRVTRVTTWWRQLSFRAIVLIWNRKGRVGVGVAKWSDVSIAVTKATREAYKTVVTTPITDSQSVPYEQVTKFKSAVVKLIPAAQGTWLKAWSSVRMVLELAGYNNILSKIMWTNNKLNNAIATVKALSSFKNGKSPKKKAPAKTEWKAKTATKAKAPKAEKKTPAKKDTK